MSMAFSSWFSLLDTEEISSFVAQLPEPAPHANAIQVMWYMITSEDSIDKIGSFGVTRNA